MNAYIASLLLLVLAVALSSGQTYTDRYDNIDLDEILSNRRLMKSYLDCILEKGRCTADGKELKSHIADALQTGCEKCTDSQRNGSKKVINHLIVNEPVYWGELVDTYDPDRVYTQQYEDDLKAEE